MGRNIDWLEPSKWEMVDRELCNLMDRLDGEVGLEVVFANRELSGGYGLIGSGCERVAGACGVLLGGVKGRRDVVEVQRAG